MELKDLFQNTLDKTSRHAAFSKAIDMYAATCFLMGANEGLFGELKKVIGLQYTCGT